MVEGSEMPPVLRRLLRVGGGGVQAGATGGQAPPLGSLVGRRVWLGLCDAGAQQGACSVMSHPVWSWLMMGKGCRAPGERVGAVGG